MNTLEVLQILAWPAVVLLLSVLALIIFRKDISALINRINETKGPGGVSIAFGKVSTEAMAPAANISTANIPKPKFENSGNLFWVGHDLMWTFDVIARGAPREDIVHGLNQALYHVRSLGLGDTAIGERVARLRHEAEKSLQDDWKEGQRKKYMGEINAIIATIGKLASENQSTYGELA